MYRTPMRVETAHLASRCQGRSSAAAAAAAAVAVAGAGAGEVFGAADFGALAGTGTSESKAESVDGLRAGRFPSYACKSKIRVQHSDSVASLWRAAFQFFCILLLARDERTTRNFSMPT
jgi:hypothetical protein